MSATIAQQIAGLPDLTLTELWQLWDSHFDHRPNKINRAYLEGKIAYSLQEAVYGKLSNLTRNRLNKIGAQQSRISVRAKNQDIYLMPGTVLVREHGGQEHRVTVTPTGSFEYQGQTFKSLSGVARHITGTPWSGPLFFGVRK